MILATFFMGATFPIAGQLFSKRMEILGRRIGGVYSVNTVGGHLRFPHRRILPGPGPRYRADDSCRVVPELRAGSVSAGGGDGEGCGCAVGCRRSSFGRDGVDDRRALLAPKFPGSGCSDLRPAVRVTSRTQDRRTLHRHRHRLLGRGQKRQYLCASGKQLRRSADEREGGRLEWGRHDDAVAAGLPSRPPSSISGKHSRHRLRQWSQCRGCHGPSGGAACGLCRDRAGSGRRRPLV